MVIIPKKSKIIKHNKQSHGSHRVFSLKAGLTLCFSRPDSTIILFFAFCYSGLQVQ